MTAIPDDVMSAAGEASTALIDAMCTTYRHDYGLLPVEERKAIYLTFSQISYHDVRPAIARAIMAERERVREEIERLRKLNAILMGDDETVPRYTTKRLRHEIAQKIAPLEAENAKMRAALEDAKRFIRNGIEFGYIQMPDDQSDPAHKTLGVIHAALEALK